MRIRINHVNKDPLVLFCFHWNKNAFDIIHFKTKFSLLFILFYFVVSAECCSGGSLICCSRTIEISEFDDCFQLDTTVLECN